LDSRKSYAFLIVTLLALPLLTFAVPVNASTGAPYLGAIDGSNNIYIGVSDISIQAGQAIVSLVDDTDMAGENARFTIIFNYNGTNLVDFSGAQFDLYMSKNGYSNVTSDDILYASSFSTPMLDLPYGQTVVKANSRLLGGNATFTLGTGTFSDVNQGYATITAKVLTGPIPFDITPDYKFIKVWDGSNTLVAVSIQRVIVLPYIAFVPSTGPGCQLVVLSGTALKPNAVINLSYVQPVEIAGLIAQVTTDENGRFTYTWNIADLGNNNDTLSMQMIYIQAVYNATGDPVGPDIQYLEISRFFTYFQGIFPSGYGFWGNNSAPTVPVYVHGDLIVEGAYFSPCDVVTFVVEGITIGSATVLPLTGIFNASMIVPELSSGPHTVCAINNGIVYCFVINVLPTLEVTPSSGSCGTEVEFLAYGFPAESQIYIYWFNFDNSLDLWHNVVNGTTGTDGKFNVTVTYDVEHMYGGIHPIVATDFYYGPSVPDVIFSDPSSVIAPALFTMLPSIWIEPDVIDNDCTIFNVYGCGFVPYNDYYVDIDNQEFNAPTINCDLMGNIEIGLVSAGFRPGTHSVSIYGLPNSTMGGYQPVAYDCFTVSTVGDPVFGMLLSIDNSMVTIQNGIETLQLSIDELNARLVSFNNTLVTIQSTLGIIQTNIQTINGKVDIISGDLATVKTSLGSVNGTVTSIAGDVATVETQLGTVKTTLDAVKATTDQTKSFLPVDMTPIWITLILALIAAITGIIAVVSVRGKVAA